VLLCGHELFNVVGNFSIRFMGDLGRETEKYSDNLLQCFISEVLKSLIKMY